jgi:hypothetical protein
MIFKKYKLNFFLISILFFYFLLLIKINILFTYNKIIYKFNYPGVSTTMKIDIDSFLKKKHEIEVPQYGFNSKFYKVYQPYITPNLDSVELLGLYSRYYFSKKNLTVQNELLKDFNFNFLVKNLNLNFLVIYFIRNMIIILAFLLLYKWFVYFSNRLK